MKVVMVLSAIDHHVEDLAPALDYAASRKAAMAVVFIMDEKVPAAIFEKLTDIGFIGEKPGAELESAVSAEYRRQAEEMLAEVKKEAAKAGIETTTDIVSGDFVEKSLENIAKHAADTLVIVRTRQSWLSRALARTGADELLRSSPCEIKVFET